VRMHDSRRSREVPVGAEFVNIVPRCFQCAATSIRRDSVELVGSVVPSYQPRQGAAVRRKQGFQEGGNRHRRRRDSWSGAGNGLQRQPQRTGNDFAPPIARDVHHRADRKMPRIVETMTGLAQEDQIFLGGRGPDFKRDDVRCFDFAPPEAITTALSISAEKNASQGASRLSFPGQRIQKSNFFELLAHAMADGAG
jgi:hypothetical protein